MTSDVTLPLTDEEADYLRDILILWINGHEDGTEDIVRDQSIEEPEELLDLVDNYTEQMNRAIEIRNKLTIAMRKGDD